MVTSRTPQEKLIDLATNWCPSLKRIQTTFYIAGGFQRALYANETPVDMDVFFPSEKELHIFYNHLASDGWTESLRTDTAIGLVKDGKLVQLISHRFGTVEEILDSFDFTIAKCALVHKKDSWKEYLHELFFEDLAGRKLVFTGSDMPLASLKRVFKFVDRGYTICDGELTNIVRAISTQLDWSNPDSVAQHVTQVSPGKSWIKLID